MTQQIEGHIYKLVSKQIDKYYIGSTIKPLPVRLYYHYKNKDKSNITSKQILQFNDASIELIETIMINNISELRAKEREYIILYRDECVNERGIYKDTNECNKIWREKNRDKMKEYNRINYEKNRDKINKQRRQRRQKNREQNPLPPKLTKEQLKENKKKYMEAHKDDKKKYDKLYREINKDKLNADIICECGGKYKAHHKSSHFKTKKHTTFFTEC